MFAKIVKSKLFFPLDRKLGLRHDHWSSGIARIATGHGLQSKSFALAADLFSDATGCNMSHEGLRKVTQGWGRKVSEKREEEAEALFDVKEDPSKEIVAVTNPIEKQASISTDGGFVHIREDGWKEVKKTTISSVRPKKESEKSAQPGGRKYEPYETQMMLEGHSYQVGFWKADEMGKHQYRAGVRRDLENCLNISSTNDGAKWIKRITEENFPNVTQIVDWFHAAEKMWGIGKQTIGDQEDRKKWVETCLDDLWMGRLENVNLDLGTVDTRQAINTDEVKTDIGYFEKQQDRMKYNQYRIAGYPIGSGSVESGINGVVHHRMKRQGQGWARANVNPMLAALSELHSGRFHQEWKNTQ
jgi:hypothetical protein